MANRPCASALVCSVSSMPAASESRPTSSLADLAECMVEQGNPGAAETLQQRALALREKANPGGLPSAYSLAGLGKIARIRGDLTKAQEYYSQSLIIAENVNAPDRDRAKLFIIATASLMADFYRAMEHDGMRPAAALRAAQIQMWKTETVELSILLGCLSNPR
jgi:tetratricopeptide (TPR) repeat protein